MVTPVYPPKSPDTDIDGNTYAEGVYDAVVALWDGIAAEGLVRTSNWTQLSAITGMRVGQPGEVMTDTGGHTDPTTGFPLPDDRGRYAWTAAGWQWVGELVDTALERVMSRAAALLAPGAEIILDLHDLLGGGAAVYVPIAIHMATSAGVLINLSLAADSKMPSWHKVPVTYAGVALQTVYIDGWDPDVPVKVATYPDEVPYHPTRYFPLVSIFGGEIGWSAGGIRVASAQRLETSAMVVQGGLMVDLPAGKLYVPPIYGVVTNGSSWSLAPETAGTWWREVDLPSPAPGVEMPVTQVYVDVAETRLHGTDSPAALKTLVGYGPDAPRVSAGGWLVPLGTLYEGGFTPAPDMAVCETVANAFGHGREDNDGAPTHYGTSAPVDLTSAAAATLGFVRGWQNTGDALCYYGGLLAEPVATGRVWYRIFVEADGTTPPPAVLGYGLRGGGLSVVALSGWAHLAKTHSTHCWEYVGLLDLPADGAPWHGIWVGCNGSSPGSHRVFGLQFAVGAEVRPYISRVDYPRAADLIGTRLRALEAGDGGGGADGVIVPVIPPRLYVMEGRPYPLYLDQMLDPSYLRGRYRASLAGPVPVAGEYGPPFAIEADGGGAFFLPLDRLGSSATLNLTFVDLKGTAGEVFGGPVEVVKVSAGAVDALSFSVLSMGDSLTDWCGTMLQAIRRLTLLGATVTGVGTVQNGSGAARYGEVSYPLGEARSGTAFLDYINDASSVLAPVSAGGESAYLALTDTDKRTKNPFAKVPTSGDLADKADMVKSGHIFDMRFYLDRFGFSDPDCVYIALGTNDITRAASLEAALAALSTGLNIVLSQTREALPSAKIIIGWHTIGHSVAADSRRSTLHLACLRHVVEIIRARADANIHIVPIYCTVSRDTGFPTTDTTDPDSGLVTGENSDPIHYSERGETQVGEVLMQHIAGVMAGL